VLLANPRNRLTNGTPQETSEITLSPTPIATARSTSSQTGTALFVAMISSPNSGLNRKVWVNGMIAHSAMNGSALSSAKRSAGAISPCTAACSVTSGENVAAKVLLSRRHHGSDPSSQARGPVICGRNAGSGRGSSGSS
jgi:hypothetical protein